jgi:hypothetical protein
MRWAAAALAALALAPGVARAQDVATSFPPGFPVILDHSLGTPVLGFGGAGTVGHVPVIFLHGNNDTPYPTNCNGGYGKIVDFAQYFRDHGYELGELWALGYQGDQCDLPSNPAHKSGVTHSTLANVPDLRAFVQAVLDYTGARQVDIVGHSLGLTIAREWMRQDDAYATVRTLVGVDGVNHGIIDCSPSPENYFQPDAAGGFNPDSALCLELGSDHTPLLRALNAGDESPPPTRYVMIVNADKSFVYFSSQDGVLPPVPAEDRDGKPHDFSRSAWLAGADKTYELTDQGVYDNVLQASHTGIANSPEAWADAFAELSPLPAAAAPSPAAAPSGSPAASAPAGLAVPRLVARVTRRGRRYRTSGRLVVPAGVDRLLACRGAVSVQVRAGRLTISTRRARLRPDCTFASRVGFARARRRLTFSVRFFGNTVLAGAAAQRRG